MENALTATSNDHASVVMVHLLNGFIIIITITITVTVTVTVLVIVTVTITITVTVTVLVIIVKQIQNVICQLRMKAN